MNKNRRKKIQNIKDKLLDLLTEIEEIRDEEQEAYDNLRADVARRECFKSI